MDRVFLSQDFDMKIHHVMTDRIGKNRAKLFCPSSGKKVQPVVKTIYRKGSENKEQN